MNKLIFLISTILIFTSHTAQVEIIGNWVLNKSWFTDSTINLIKADKNEIWQYYTFSKDHIIKHKVPNSIGCQAGETIIYEGKWFLKNNNLLIDVKGKVISKKLFHYRKIFKIVKSTNNELLLKLDSTIINKELNPNKKLIDLEK